jgi:hypothetical protein
LHHAMGAGNIAERDRYEHRVVSGKVAAVCRGFTTR